MPLWEDIVALLRQRVVLGIIFSLSVMYCGLTLYSDRKGFSYRVDTDDTDAKILGDDNGNDLMDDDFSNIIPNKIIWNSDSINKDNSLENDINKTDSAVKRSCQNSVQGKTLIVDDKGFVCARHDILPNGCCKIEGENEKSIKTELYSCKTCNYQGCCAIYEYCVSCCLHPAKHLKLKKKSETDLKHKENLKTRRGEDILRLKMRHLDRFQICLAACRTSSASVRHENTYKDPHLKYCYITNHVASSLDSQHLFRRDLVSVNEDVDLSVVVSPPNSTSIFDHVMR